MLYELPVAARLLDLGFTTIRNRVLTDRCTGLEKNIPDGLRPAAFLCRARATR
ncbi:hypothetical protein KCP71_09980 [Salmonella enterica subsp. enterica]|nr:hypothetical protein KCP71_09980 [Salmonella enterica subsp. enterica]